MANPFPVTATVLMENTTARSDLTAEHGLSVYIETPGGAIVWDTGQSPAFIENARTLGVPVETAGHIALSHGHYDHTGGLSALLALNPAAHVHGHPELFTQRYTLRSADGLSSWPVGSPVSREDVAASCASLHLERGMTEPIPGVFLTGEIPRDSGIEDTGGDFFLDTVCVRRDPLPDDQALFVDSPRGIVLFLGCAHSGVINTLTHIARLTGARTIYAVMGGMHLLRASDARLEETAGILDRYDVQLIGPCHCTGDRAQAFFRSRFPERIVTFGTGSRIELADG